MPRAGAEGRGKYGESCRITGADLPGQPHKGAAAVSRAVTGGTCRKSGHQSAYGQPDRGRADGNVCGNIPETRTCTQRGCGLLCREEQPNSGDRHAEGILRRMKCMQKGEQEVVAQTVHALADALEKNRRG